MAAVSDGALADRLNGPGDASSCERWAWRAILGVVLFTDISGKTTSASRGDGCGQTPCWNRLTTKFYDTAQPFG